MSSSRTVVLKRLLSPQEVVTLWWPKLSLMGLKLQVKAEQRETVCFSESGRAVSTVRYIMRTDAARVGNASSGVMRDRIP